MNHAYTYLIIYQYHYLDGSEGISYQKIVCNSANDAHIAFVNSRDSLDDFKILEFVRLDKEFVFEESLLWQKT